MHGSRLGGLIIDCKTDDLNKEAAFWSNALGYEIRPSDDPDDKKYVVLDTPEGEPYIGLQSVEHPSRVHLDIKTDNLEAEVQRLERLGATRVKMVKDWWIMEAPSGHRFCVIPLEPDENTGMLNPWSDSA